MSDYKLILIYQDWQYKFNIHFFSQSRRCTDYTSDPVHFPMQNSEILLNLKTKRTTLRFNSNYRRKTHEVFHQPPIKKYDHHQSK